MKILVILLLLSTNCFAALTPGNVPKVKTGGTSPSLENGSISDNGNIGIGSISPGQELDVAGDVHTGAGSVTIPAHGFTADRDSGMYSGGANDLRFGSGGVNALTINASQNIGIGTITPIAKLQMAASGSPSYTDGIFFTRLSNAALGFGLWYSNSGNTTSYIESRLDSASASMNFRMRAAGTPVEAMTIIGSGNIGVGTTIPGGGLTVMNGNVGIGTWKPTGVLAVSGTNGIISPKQTADPCVNDTNDGMLFWNDTAAELCYCDNSGVDLRVKDATTACF